MSAIRKRLVLKSKISDLWKQTLLSAHGELLMSLHGVVSHLVLILDSRRLYALAL